MPRSGDLYPQRRGGNDIRSPLNRLLDWTSPLDMTAGAAGAAIRAKIEDVVAFIYDETGVDLSGLVAAFDGIDLGAPGAVLEAIIANAGDPVGLIRAITHLDLPDDVADPLSYLENFNVLGAETPLNAQNLFNTLPTNLIGMVPYSVIGDAIINLLANPTFEGPESVQDSRGVWQWDNTTGATTLGNMFIDPTGATEQILTNAVPAAAGDQFATAIKAMWSGLAYTGVPFSVQIVELLDHAQVNVVDVITPAGVGANQATWLPITGTPYTVPAAGVDAVCLQITRAATVTAGRIRFDEAELTKTGLLQMPWVDGLPDELAGLWTRAQTIVDTIHNAITDAGLTDIGLPVLSDALSSIPWWKVTGYGGPGTSGDTHQATWDELAMGFVDAIGSGVSLPDLQSLARAVSSAATRGSWAFDITGIRNNEDFNNGMLPTSRTSLGLLQVGTGTAAPTFALTQATAITLYERVKASSPLGVIRWMGAGITNISGFFVNIWKMDPATELKTLVHASPNIIGDVSAAMSTNKYVVPVTIQREPGEVYGYELAIREAVAGATHTIVGQPTWLHDDPDVFPRRVSSVRNSGTTAPPATLATTTYADKIPFIEAAISLAGVVATPHTAETRQWTQAGTFTYPVPSWANFVDGVVVGEGGDGFPGSTTIGVNGKGGENGNWQTVTWQRGVHFTGAVVVTVTSPTAGSGANSGLSIPGQPAITGTPGVNGNTWGSPSAGQPAGTTTYQGHPYVGGTQQNTLGANGVSPGGGGAGGGYAQSGGAGAPASAWLTFRQS